MLMFVLWGCCAFSFPTREARELAEGLQSREKELVKDVEIAGR